VRLRPSGEPVLQEVEQAVKRGIRDIYLWNVRSAIQSQASALVYGLGADLWSKPWQHRQVLPVLWRTGYRSQIKSNRSDEVKSLDLV
jgi:hypothetical protein